MTDKRTEKINALEKDIDHLLAKIKELLDSAEQSVRQQNHEGAQIFLRAAYQHADVTQACRRVIKYHREDKQPEEKTIFENPTRGLMSASAYREALSAWMRDYADKRPHAQFLADLIAEQK